jgi:thioredoxin-related protein
MNKETWIMGITVTILFVLTIIGFNMRQTAIEKTNQAYPNNNWKSDDWGTKTQPNIVENKPEPIKEKPKTDEQIIAKSYDEALKVSKEKNMTIVIFFHGKSCHWCDKMKTVLDDKEVANSLKKYIYLKVDASVDINLKNKYKIRAIPQFIIINDKEEIQKSKSGFMNKDTFIKWLSN